MTRRARRAPAAIAKRTPRGAARGRHVLIGLLAIAVALAIVWGWRARGGTARATPPPREPTATAPVRPSAPPPPGAPRTRVATPEMPPDGAAIAAAAFARAQAAGLPPGEAAFRAMVHAFIEYNAEFARAQAAKEGLTVAEVEALTYLGFLAMATQRLSDLEELTGRAYGEADRERIAQVMRTHNDGFKDALRAAVARGAPEAERWRLIRDTEAAFKADLFAATGLDDELLDGLLAGDLAKPGAPMTSAIPDEIEPRPYVADQPRPAAPR